MKPGERLRMQLPGVETREVRGSWVDRPNIEHLTAWQRGEVVLDNAPISDAVAEMNRYGKPPVVIVNMKAIGGLRISGAMRAGDSEAFAQAVASLHGLSVRRTDGRIELDK